MFDNAKRIIHMRRKGNKTEIKISTFNAKKCLYYCNALILAKKRRVYQCQKKISHIKRKGSKTWSWDTCNAKACLYFGIISSQQKRHVWQCQKNHSYEKKGKQNCDLEWIILIEMRKHVVIIETSCFSTKKKDTFDTAKNIVHVKRRGNKTV